MSTLPFSQPDRIKPKFRPFKALGHFRKLIADKEDTTQVFYIFEALPRKGFVDDVRAFMGSKKGAQIIKREANLAPLLDDHARLRQMPDGSVAHAYCDFMEREGLSAAGLVAEYDKFSRRKFNDQIEQYGNRLRDTHDLLHVLTGYGRDALGEACVLAFTYGQNPAPANLFIGYAAAFNIKRTTKSKAPIMQAVKEARALGRACPRIAEMEIGALLAEPLDDVRRRFNITPPKYYVEAHAIMRSEGLNPFSSYEELEAKKRQLAAA
jgi:ubiquinone biosynthesis protein COQ4